jgi:hypothetical protein
MSGSGKPEDSTVTVMNPSKYRIEGERFGYPRGDDEPQKSEPENAICLRNHRRSVIFLASILTLAGIGRAAQGESAKLKIGGLVDLAPFSCQSVMRSSVVKRICYDPSISYLLIKLKGVWREYCNVDPGTVSRLVGAESTWSFYNNSIRGSFECEALRSQAVTSGAKCGCYPQTANRSVNLE